MNEVDQKELDAALARLIDGEPEPPDEAMLATEMAGNDEFARGVVELLMLDDLLRQNGSPDDSAFTASLAIRLGAERDGGEFLQNLNHRMRRAPRTSTSRRRVIQRITVTAAAVLLLLAGGTVGYRQRGGEPRERLTSPISTCGVDRASALTRSAVAVLTRVVDARWEPAGVSINAGSALSPGHLRLASGLAQIEFISGASVIIEGPCDFELLSPTNAVCHQGKVRAHVPHNARGFTVSAPGLDAVDLGTEFAMSIDERGRGQVQVLEGEIELRGRGDHPATREVKIIKVGRGASFGPGAELQETAAAPDDFVVDRSTFLRLQYAHDRQRYDRWVEHSQALRTDPAIVLYYSFEDNNTWERDLRNVAAPGGESLNGAVVGCLWCPGRWPGKTALDFKGIRDSVRIDVPGRFDQLSLAIWVRVEGLNWLNALMLTDDWDPGEAHWQLTHLGQIRLGVRSQNGHQNDVDYDSGVGLGPTDIGKWVHIATVYSSPDKFVRHYLNGKQVSESRLRELIALKIGAATIGNWWTTVPYLLSDRLRNLNGRVDEFVIFRRVLTNDEIKRMYELGKPNL